MNNVLVRKVEKVEETASKIIMSTKTQAPNVGVVMEVGEGQLTNEGVPVPMLVNVGDKVLLPDFGGKEVDLQDGSFFLYRDTELLGVLSE